MRSGRCTLRYYSQVSVTPFQRLVYHKKRWINLKISSCSPFKKEWALCKAIPRHCYTDLHSSWDTASTTSTLFI
eukprot:2541771-Ditylum_brightwellii.AAC.1